MALDNERAQRDIQAGNTSLGLELGSTRIKAVLIGEDHVPLAAGSHDWENRLVDGVWTYALEDIWAGVRDCYAKLKQDVLERYKLVLTTVGGMGVSGMMHGYLVFDRAGRLLVPFRTWRNTTTAQASEELTARFGYPIPHRWSIAHLYQAILNKEAHVPDIACMTTLAGYIHWQLTGQRVVGVGEASGMFPIDLATGRFNESMIRQFDELTEEKGIPWRLRDLLPDILPAGQAAGRLTEEGAKLLDPSLSLKAGVPLCPPEGDAGTGMTATNSVAPRTGNVSAGTSLFLMAVLENDLKRVHPEIDLVTTPAGDLVAMVHCNNGTGDIDAWARVFDEFAQAAGVKLSKTALYGALYRRALEADADCGGLLSYNYLSGESITGLEEGRPLVARGPDSRLTLANFMRMHLYSAMATMKMGLDILRGEEQVRLDSVCGHGGFFKTEGVGQRMMAAALETPVTVMETAGEGGPWGMALLAAYMQKKSPGESLPGYLSGKVFAPSQGRALPPDPADVEGFRAYMARYRAGLDVERLAAKTL